MAEFEHTPAMIADAEFQDIIHDHTPPVFASPKQPMEVARQLLQRLFTVGEDRTLVHWQGLWYTWETTHWVAVSEAEVKQQLWFCLEGAQYVKNADGEKAAWPVSRYNISGVLEPLQMLCMLPRGTNTPCWIGTPPKGAKAPNRLVSMTNGLLCLDTLELQPHTPRLFNTYSLGFDYAPHATCPRWERFMSEVMAHDLLGLELLQQWFGYVVSGDTSRQKGLLLIGVSRSGKGVISRTLQRLIGLENCTAPTLQSMTNKFGLEPWIGKQLAVVGDVRVSRKGTEVVAERLLNIIGQDRVSVEPKGRKILDMVLPARVMMSSNEVPGILDASGAIVGRFMMVKFQTSFLGREDIHLEDKLACELSGIFNWSIRGLRHLEKQGRFTVPATMEELATSMRELSSPVTAFINDTFDVTGNETDVVLEKDLAQKYRAWCMDNGNSACSNPVLKTRIQAAFTTVQWKNTSIGGGKKSRWYLGLKLKTDNYFSAEH